MAHKPSICTMSLGRCFAGHSLQHKLDMARKYAFQGIELFYQDLVDLAQGMPGGSSPSNQLRAASIIRKLCDARDLSIICLQPFMQYEGLVDRDLHRERVSEMHHWIELAHTLGTDLIMLPSSTLAAERVTANMDVIVGDMVEIAEIGLGASPVVRFAFEALSWGTRIDTWEASWDVVRRVDRSNFGICLDTFNIAGRIYADPTSHSGRTPRCEYQVAKSMDTLISSVPSTRIFLLQVADGERLTTPLTPQHPFYNPEQPPRMSWSRNARLFYGESQHGGYLPVRNMLDVMVNKMGYEGWLSFEVFNRRLTHTDADVPEEMARRAAKSWQKMVLDVGLKAAHSSLAGIQAAL